MAKERNTEGRKANAALPLGDRDGEDSPEEIGRQARRERRSAGPDGPDASEITRLSGFRPRKEP